MSGRKRLVRRIALLAGALLLVWVIVEIALAGRGTPPLPPGQTPIDLRGGHVMNNHISTKSWSFDYDHARLAPDGLTYVESWVEASLDRCFQLMECDDVTLLQQWVA